MAFKRRRILVAPLDWGMGHSSRCIPIIREFMHLGCEVLVACNSGQKKFFEQEIPGISTVDLQGYELRYGRNRLNTLLKILIQVPKILIKIKQEKRWLKQKLTELSIDAVISDNRFGLYSNMVPCIFITHQLAIQTGLGILANRIVREWNYQAIGRFSACWIPDIENPPSLAGSLSHPPFIPPVPIEFLGLLSRLSPCNSKPVNDEILVLLSGPEPQRTILEKILLPQLESLERSVVLVRGVQEKFSYAESKNVRIINFASSEMLQPLICSASLVISRSGYSSMMDLLKLGKKLVVIPTPGQAEQEYLASYLHRQQWAFAIKQEELDLRQAIRDANKFPYRPFPGESGSDPLLSRKVRIFLESLPERTTQPPHFITKKHEE